MLSGDNALLNQAGNAKTQTLHATVYEQLQLEAQGYYTDYVLNSAEYSTLIEYLQSKGIIDENKVVNVEKLLGSKQSLGNGTIETGDVYVLEENEENAEVSKVASVGNNFKIAETTSSSVKQYKLVYYDTNSSEDSKYIGLIPGFGETVAGNVEPISTEQSYVGYYADIDGDSTPDGIIYADLLCGPFDGTWVYDSYSISDEDKITSSKDYYVISEGYSGDFGTNDVIAVSTGSEGDERFYVMTLEDFSTTIEEESCSTFIWYASTAALMQEDTSHPSYNSPSEAVSAGKSYYGAYLPKDTSTAFGTGKDNTSNMISKWESEYYGTKIDYDVWGVIEEKAGMGWFLPSKDEWIAFLTNMNVTKDNYFSKGLSNGYLSSSEYEVSSTEWKCGYTWYAYLKGNIMSCDRYTGSWWSVRLSTTF